MNLLDTLKDLCFRLYKIETEYQPKIDALVNEINALNANYNKMKGKEPNLWLQGTVIVTIAFSILFVAGLLLFALSPDTASPAGFLIFCVILCVALLIFNAIRAKSAYAVRKKRAENWWESTGKPDALILKRNMDDITEEGRDFLRQNPLVDQIPECYLTEEHCLGIHKILLQRRAVSLEEAISVYDDVRHAEHERWMEKHENDRRWEEFSERQAQMQRTLEQTERDLAYSELMLDEIRIRQKYGD